MEGRSVELEDTLRGCEKILSGEMDDVPENAFYMVGTIEDVLAKAEKMKEAQSAA